MKLTDFIAQDGKFRAGFRWKTYSDGDILHETYQFSTLEEVEQRWEFLEKHQDVKYFEVVTYEPGYTHIKVVKKSLQTR